MDTVKRGRAWIYADNVDTDVIIPARYLNTTDHKELASHCMEDIDETFAKNVQECGISVIIAKSFARIFYRNAINIGLPILESPTLPDETDKFDIIEVDLAKGAIVNTTKNKTYQAA